MIDAECQTGGVLRRSDLENRNIFKRNPITWEYRGATFISNPPLSSGGMLISFALGLLDDLSVSGKNFGSYMHLQDLAHVMKLKDQARIEAEIYSVDPTNTHEALFAPELLEKYWGMIWAHPLPVVELYISELLMLMAMQRN